MELLRLAESIAPGREPQVLLQLRSECPNLNTFHMLQMES